MKIERFNWVYNCNGIKFVDLKILKEIVDRQLFCAQVFSSLDTHYKNKDFRNNLFPLDIFEKIIKQYPKKKNCWCLSGLKFIDCHFNRKNKLHNKNHQQNEKFKKIITHPECLHRNVTSCSNKIIKAHSISNKGSLSSISQKNHVYGFKMGFQGLEFTKIGVNNASTFYGFCKKHDDLLFSSFEKSNFEKTSKQLFDLCYRAICQEHYTVLRTIDLFKEIKKTIDIGYDLIEQIELQISINSQIYFHDLGIKYSEYYKKQLEKKYSQLHHEDCLKHYIFELDKNYPKFQSSSCFNLEFDLNGQRLQNLDKAYIQSKNIFINCISLQSKGYFIISWFKENDYFGKKIINSIISTPSLIEDKLFSLVFLYIHNTFVSPEWFESLTEQQKNNIKILQDFWGEQDKFSTSLIQSNMNSIKVKAHYFHPTLPEKNL